MFREKRVANFTEGPIFSKILLFALPIMLTGLLQTLYNIADTVVVGFSPAADEAIGSIGSTAAINSFLLNIIIGISGGAGVVVAQSIGAKEHERVSRATHTAMALSLIIGFALSAISFALTKPILMLNDTKSELLDGAVLYLRIICLGLPASSVCNFAASILRSSGDSKAPMIILSSSGIVNVLLNLFFVLLCGMDVAGVALATIISQYLSAIFMVLMLAMKKGQSHAFSFKKMAIHTSELKRILSLGVPAGIQGSLFSLGNIVITNGVNSFPPTTMTAYTITNQIDAITFVIINAFQHATTTFVGQNYGARRPDRIKKVFLFAIIQVASVGILVAQAELLFAEEFCTLFLLSENTTPADKEIIISTAIQMMQMFLNTYFLCGIMETFTGTLRGLGHSVAPMIMTLTGACGFRIFWRFFIFPKFFSDSPLGLLISFPLSWIITIIMLAITLIIVWKKTKSRLYKSSDGAEVKNAK